MMAVPVGGAVTRSMPVEANSRHSTRVRSAGRLIASQGSGAAAVSSVT